MAIDLKGLKPATTGKRDYSIPTGVGTGNPGRGEASPLRPTINQSNTLGVASAVSQMDTAKLVTDALVKYDNAKTNAAIQLDKINYENDANTFTKNQIINDSNFYKETIKKYEKGEITLDTLTINEQIDKHIDKGIIDFENNSNLIFKKKHQGIFYTNLDPRKNHLTNKLANYINTIGAVRVQDGINNITSAVQKDKIIIDGMEYKDATIGANALNVYITQILSNAKSLGNPINISYAGVKREFESTDIEKAKKYLQTITAIEVAANFGFKNNYLTTDGKVTQYVNFDKIKKEINKDKKLSLEDKQIQNDIFSEYKKEQKTRIDANNSAAITKFITDRSSGIDFNTALKTALSDSYFINSDTRNNFIKQLNELNNVSADPSVNKIINGDANNELRKYVATNNTDLTTKIILKNEIEGRSILERYLDPKDKTVDSHTFKFANDVLEGKLGIITNAKYLENRITDINNDKGEFGARSIIMMGDVPSRKRDPNKLNLATRYSHFQNELRQQILSLIINSKDKSESTIKQIIDNQTNISNPDSIIQKLLQKYQLKKSNFKGKEYIPGYDFTNKTITPVFDDDTEATSYGTLTRVVNNKVYKTNLDDPGARNLLRNQYINAFNKGEGQKFIDYLVDKTTLDFTYLVAIEYLQLRPDGSVKNLETGYLGKIIGDDGQAMTEYSIDIEIDGKKYLIPTLVPGLNADEIAEIKSMPENLSESIIKKATEHAMTRLKNNLPVFYDENTDKGP